MLLYSYFCTLNEAELSSFTQWLLERANLGELLDIGLQHITKSSIIPLSEAQEDNALFSVRLNLRVLSSGRSFCCLQSFPSSKGFNEIDISE